MSKIEVCKYQKQNIINYDWAVNIVLLLLPWLLIVAVMVWGMYFGPNRIPRWQFGDRILYDWFLEKVIPGISLGIVIFSGIQIAICRTHFFIKTVIIISTLAAMFTAPAFAFA